MFDKPNQLIFYINVLISVFGILVAVFCKFIVIGLLISAAAILLIRDQFQQNKSKFIISRLEKTLIIYDTCGSKAAQTQKQMITSCHAGNSEFWFKHIRSAGNMSNFKINGTPPAEQKIEEQALQVCMKFPPELKATEEFNMTLTYDLRNAFIKTQETLSHVVDTDTKLLRLVVQLPSGRPATSAHVCCKPDGADNSQLPAAVIEQAMITVDIPEPVLGAEYCLQWDWPREGVVQRLGCLLKT